LSNHIKQTGFWIGDRYVIETDDTIGLSREFTLIVKASDLAGNRIIEFYEYMTYGHGYLIGRMVDDNNEPLIFTNIYFRELNKTVRTDDNGSFELRLTPGDHELSFIVEGYLMQNISVSILPDVYNEAGTFVLEPVEKDIKEKETNNNIILIMIILAILLMIAIASLIIIFRPRPIQEIKEE